MKRRTWLQWAGLSAGLSACGDKATTTQPVATAPNILQIALDDLNDWVGFLGGYPGVKTPNLDALAARSSVFRHAYCTVPVCSGSRAGVLSGLTARHTGVYDLSTWFKAANPNKRAFDEMLTSAGYTVQRHGKVDHMWNDRVALPLPDIRPIANHTCPTSYDEGAFDWGPAVGGDSSQPDHVFTQRGIDFLNQFQGDRFCLSVGLYRNHVAWYVPQRFIDLYPLDQIIIPNAPSDDLDDLGPEAKAFALKFNFHECITSQGLWAQAVQGYLATISWVDEQVGRLLAALSASPYANNTMIVLWSDHGFHLGEKFHWHKLALWEHCTRVPCLISLPGQTQSQSVDAGVSLADIAPTVLDYCGVVSDYAMDGRSLRSFIETPDSAWDRPVLTTLNTNNHAIRTAKWRYIRYAGGEQELYDEASDQGEYVNLAGDPIYDSVMAELGGYMPDPV